MNRPVELIRCCVVVAGVCLVAAGCSSQGPESSGATASGGEAASSSTGGLVIAFQSEPDPPASGSNAIEVTVTGPDGAPVTDGDVAVVFSMPAMPSMNMPAMRSDTTLTHASGGRYRGTGRLEMGGTWNVVVTVSRGGEEIGSRKLSIVAR